MTAKWNRNGSEGVPLTDLEKSILIKVGMKLVHPNAYVGGSDLEEFEVFITDILRWLKMNCLWELTSTKIQVSYLDTHLSSEAQEWFYRNVEQLDLGNSGARAAEKIPAHSDTPSCIKQVQLSIPRDKDHSRDDKQSLEVCSVDDTSVQCIYVPEMEHFCIA